MGPLFLHITAPIGDALGVRCTGCGHKTIYHHAVNFGSWNCDKCGGRCSSVVKTAALHATHNLANSFNNMFELIHCTNCGHLTNEHDDDGLGKWKCRKCGKTCVS